MLIELTQYDVDQARSLAAQINSNLAKVPNYTGLHEPDRFETGYLGEFAVREWLRFEQIGFEYFINTSGTSQPCEFDVADVGGLEVKTASKPSYRMLMWPVDQRIDFKCVVAARLEGPTTVNLMGWLGINDVCKMGRKVFKGPLSYFCPFEELRTMERLAKRLRFAQFQAWCNA